MRIRRSARLLAVALVVAGAPAVLAAPPRPPAELARQSAAARERLLADVVDGGDLAGALQARFGDRLGPTYYDDTPAGPVYVVGIVGLTRADERVVAELVGTPGLVEVRPARHTPEEVWAFADRLRARLDAARLPFVGIGVAAPLLPERLVVTTASPLAEAARQALRAGVPIPVDFRVGGPAIAAHETSRMDAPPYEAGLRLSLTKTDDNPVHERFYSECTSGFTAYSRTTRKYYGTTAGHCGPNGSKVRIGLADSEASGKIDVNGYYEEPGSEVRSDSARFPIRKGDATKGVIARAPNDHLLPSAVLDWANLHRRFGQRFCYVGAFSDRERCGRLDKSERYFSMATMPPDPEMPDRLLVDLFCLTMSDPPGMMAGDSGAPVYLLHPGGRTYAAGMGVVYKYEVVDGGVRDLACFQALDRLAERLDVEVLFDGWVDPAGQANGDSAYPLTSKTGQHVAFWSEASNLVNSDSNGVSDVFVRDTVAGRTVRVSVGSSGQQAAGPSRLLDLTPDGRYVLFASEAANLVPGDTNDHEDVFLRDLVLGTTTRVSVGPAGQQMIFSRQGSISPNGRYVALTMAEAPSSQASAYLRDRAAGTTTLVSVDSAGRPGAGFGAAVSADGRYVAFSSFARLVPEDTDGELDVYVRDLTLGTTTRASVNSRGEQAVRGGGNYPSEPAISDDGRYVLFVSRATNFDGHDANWPAVFVRDRLLGTTTRVQLDSSGRPIVGSPTQDPRLSPDGRHAAFVVDVAVYVRDLVAGTTWLAHEDDYATTLGIRGVGLSASGRYVVFGTVEPLVAGDTNGAFDVYRRNRSTGAVTRISRP